MTDELAVRRRARGNRFRQHYSDEDMLDAIRRWADLYGEPPRRSDWDSTRARQLGEKLQQNAQGWAARISLWERGGWPSTRAITDRFGTWNQAIEKAGFTARAPGQKTRRGNYKGELLPRMALFGHCVTAVYEAAYGDDPELLRIELERIARIAARLAEGLDDDEVAELAFGLKHGEV